MAAAGQMLVAESVVRELTRVVTGNMLSLSAVMMFTLEEALFRQEVHQQSELPNGVPVNGLPSGNLSQMGKVLIII